MKINKLRIKNIHSLKGENVIDFSAPPLSETGIFAIIGPTGSGKSTILDAIALALYNRIPRAGQNLSKKTITAQGSVLSQNTNDCYAELEYEVDKQVYRSKWSIKKARTGNLRDYEMELAKMPEGEIFDLKKSQVPEKNTQIIGLDYDQFVKSILLSQGEFAKFLKANAYERGDLLEKITGTAIYRKIGAAAFQRQKEEKEKLQQIDLLLNSISLQTDDEIKALKKQNEENKLKIQKKNTEIEDNNKLLQTKKNIRKLQDEAALKKIELNKQNDDYAAFKPQIELLDKQEQLLRFKAELMEIRHITKQIEGIKSKTAELKKKDKDFSEKIVLAKENKLKTNKILENLTQEFEKTKPVIEQCVKLDNEAKIVKEKLNAEQKQRSKKYREIETFRLKSEKLKKQIKEAENVKEKLQKQLKNTPELEDLNTELALIKEGLLVFRKNKTIAENAIEASDKPIRNKLQKLKLWSEKDDFVKAEIEKIKQKIKQLRTSTSYNMDDLKLVGTQKDRANEKLRETKKLQELSENYLKKTKILENVEQKITQLKSDLKKNDETIAVFNAEKKIAQLKIEELKIKHERQQLEKNYENDRKKLQHNSACPLCGSTIHPYVRSYKNELDQTNALLKETEEKYNLLVSEIQRKEKNGAVKQTEIRGKEAEQNDLKNEKKNICAEFEKICEKTKTNLQIAETKQIQTLIEKYEAQIEALNLAIQNLEKQQELNKNLQTFVQINEKIAQLIESFSKQKTYLKKYDAHFVDKTAYEENLNRLQQINDEFLKNKQILTETENSILTHTQILQDTKNELIKLETDHKNQEKNCKETEAIHEQLLAERKKLFGNKNPEKESKNFTAQIAKHQSILFTLSNDLARQEEQKKSVDAQIVERKKELDENCSMKEEKQSDILPQIEVLGFSSVDNALKNTLSEKKLNEIKTRKKSLEESIHLFNELLTELNKKIDAEKQKDSSETSIDELEKQIGTDKKAVQLINQDIGIISNKISKNEQDKLVYLEHFKKKEKQEQEFLRWHKLNEMIGDREGKRFSKFAQELTLQQLIKLANIHLNSLNNRFAIAKPSQSSQDDIVIIDKFLGNTERSVKTLSGGESFLVSLALALGLSDLAGQNTKIESLFIDEGFGTLDQQTLDEALAALEKLQNKSNRTIGIISHVRALKERITTRIELSKVSSGFSKITINS